MIRFTANQLILLLQIYRGTFHDEVHPGTLNNDLRFLIDNGFVKQIKSTAAAGNMSYDTTEAGAFFVKVKVLGEQP